MRRLLRRHIGQILLDGKFLSRRDLDRALEEQKKTKELLGQVLVRMGVLKETDVKAPLLLQEHLSLLEDAVKAAAGQRKLLGALLVQSGKITYEQIDQAIAEQKRTGEKLGEVFIRLGLLTERQLNAILDFQFYQTAATDGPLRLGELLIATGHISREQLDRALAKQSFTHKKLGEVLVEEGYARPSQIKQGIHLQKMLINSLLAAVLSMSMSTISSASSVVLQWDPNTEPDLAGYNVYYAPDPSALEGAAHLVVQSGTTTTIEGLDPTKSYRFAVTAFNNAGSESGFSNVVAVAELSPPTVEITSPVAANSVSGIVSINVNAADNVGVTKVEFYVNGVLQGADTSSPYLHSWDTSSLPQGSYTLTAKAYDAAGNVSESSRTVTVVSDAIPPTVALTAPLDNALVSGPVTINAGASDNVGVSMVEIYANGVLLFASNASPYSYTWDTTSVANGSYTLTARASDNSGNVSNSSTVTVTVNNQVVDTTAPTLSSFSLPTTATSLTVSVSSLVAADNVGVTGYLITESATKPLATASGWSSTAQTSFTFSGEGSRTAYAWAKDAAGNVSAAKTAAVAITLPDVTTPTLSSFSMPTTATSLTVAVSGLAATDNVGVTGYLITESATKPSATASGWSSTAPTSFTFSGEGSRTAYAWAKDAAGNVSAAKSASVTITLPDVTAPTVSSFSMPTTATSLTVAVSGLAATDDRGVTGYLITESATKPAATASGWSSTAPTSFTFSGEGSRTAYAWAKDAAGNVSAAKSASVTITLPDVTAPTVSSFSMPTTATSLTVAVSGLAATDNRGVTGYLITESATKPLATASGWSSTAPTSFTFSGEGSRTAYAWAKDAAGNVSAAKSASVTITLPDVTAPTVSSFSMPTTATSLTVAVSGLAATDDRGVTGYLITESATKPTATASGWSSTAPTSFTFSGEGSRTAYAWAKDAAGNVSAAKSASVTITLPDVTAPTVSSFSMPTTATSLTVAVSGLAATDDRGVTGYLITESATKPTATASGWSSTAPTSFTFSGEGSRTAYAWAKDAAGNVSAAKSASVTITLPDVTAPTVSSFSMPTTATSLTVAVSGFTATDNVGITGYIITESPSVPTLSASGWGSTVPASFTFSGTGTKTAYAWVRDAAGNVSSYKSATVTISDVDLIAPTITFIAPSSTYVYGPRLGISVSASDNVAVSKMEIYLDGILKLTTTSKSIKTSLRVNKGIHEIMVKAYDTSNNVSSSSKTVNRFF